MFPVVCPSSFGKRRKKWEMGAMCVVVTKMENSGLDRYNEVLSKK